LAWRQRQAEQRDLELKQYEPKCWERELERRVEAELRRGLKGRFKAEWDELERRFEAERDELDEAERRELGRRFEAELRRGLKRQFGAEWDELERQFKAERRELERRFKAEQQKYRALADEAWDVTSYRREIAERLRVAGTWAFIEERHEWGRAWRDWEDRRWTRFSRRPGPPPDPPPEQRSRWSPPSRDALWRHRHRGFITPPARNPGGAPRKANKLTRAEIQKSYRDRQRPRNPK